MCERYRERAKNARRNPEQSKNSLYLFNEKTPVFSGNTPFSLRRRFFNGKTLFSRRFLFFLFFLFFSLSFLLETRKSEFRRGEASCNWSNLAESEEPRRERGHGAPASGASSLSNRKILFTFSMRRLLFSLGTLLFSLGTLLFL